ncbi:DUF1707 domain-containing protein [Nocardia sp. NBC_01388]|uniref:DUF1707 SHOCT-like domain-containing protein n=1 Tax=Nocardia sp. NBC_01388 TaxID=2903596 RepID=UPI00324537DA
MDPAEIRAADNDRERVIGVLEQHTVAGRLSLDEYSERAAAAYRARTMGELSPLIADLPMLYPPASDRELFWHSMTRTSVLTAAFVSGLIALFVSVVAYGGPMMNGLGCG